jgi:7-cyano-7-deazaguanine synthase in queuosine biosynthesis
MSSGLDSFILWRMLQPDRCCYVRIGSPAMAAELDALEMLRLEAARRGERLFLDKVEGLPVTWEDKDGHVPYRNLGFVLAAANQYAASTNAPGGRLNIALGTLKGETSRDKSRQFARRTTKLLSYLEPTRVTVRLAARHKTKTQLVAWYRQQFPTADDLVFLLRTRSSYRAGVLPCGDCPACFRRWVALANNGIDDAFERDPWRWRGANPRAVMVNGWKHLARVAPPDLPGVAHNSLDALRAMRRVGAL